MYFSYCWYSGTVLFSGFMNALKCAAVCVLVIQIKMLNLGVGYGEEFKTVL